MGSSFSFVSHIGLLHTVLLNNKKEVIPKKDNKNGTCE